MPSRDAPACTACCCVFRLFSRGGAVALLGAGHRPRPWAAPAAAAAAAAVAATAAVAAVVAAAAAQAHIVCTQAAAVSGFAEAAAAAPAPKLGQWDRLSATPAIPADPRPPWRPSLGRTHRLHTSRAQASSSKFPLSGSRLGCATPSSSCLARSKQQTKK